MKIEVTYESVTLRSIQAEDAVFVTELRNNPKNNIFLSSTKPITVADQVEWINLYDQTSDGVYFIIQDNFTKISTGTISVYNLSSASSAAELGRFICTNPIHAIEAELMVMDFAFKIMRLETLVCKTVSENIKVWKQHYKFGFIDDGYEYMDNQRLKLKRQIITHEMYNRFDFSDLISLIKKFSSR
jgi:RimJ/RimL family protein N-acetyltransferase